MVKRSKGYIIALILVLSVASLSVISLLPGCSNDPTGPSGPNPAPGFEISNLGVLKSTRPGYWIIFIVDYKGAEGGGIEATYIRAGDGRCKDWYRYQNLGAINLGPSGSTSGVCDFNKNGTYACEIYLKDNNKRDSNLLSTTITVTGLAQ